MEFQSFYAVSKEGDARDEKSVIWDIASRFFQQDSVISRYGILSKKSSGSAGPGSLSTLSVKYDEAKFRIKNQQLV